MKQLKLSKIEITDLNEFKIPKHKGLKIENRSSYLNLDDPELIEFPLDLILSIQLMPCFVIPGDQSIFISHSFSANTARFYRGYDFPGEILNINVTLTFFIEADETT